MMQTAIRGDAAFARPSQHFSSVEFSPENILSSASFHRKLPEPLLKIIADHVTVFLLEILKP